MRNHWSLCVLGVVLGGALLWADEPPTAPPDPPTVVVPYDPAVPLDGQNPSRLYLDYETFERLWKAAKERQAQSEAAAGAAVGERAAAISSAMHAARVDGSRMIVEARYDVVTRGPDWTSVPFAWQGASVRTLTVDGAPASLRDGRLILEKSGVHRVVAEYEVPLPPGWTEASWNVPSAAATSLALRLAADDPARPEINGMPVVESQTDGARVFTAMLGGADRISVRRQLASTRAGAASGVPPLANTHERLFITSAVERLEATATFSFPDQDQRAFSLRLDPGFTLVSMEIPGLKTWNLRPQEGLAQLDFELVAAVRDTFAMRWVAERKVAAVPASLAFPSFGAAAGRLERQVVFLAGDGLDVRPDPNPQWRQVDGTPLSESEAGGFLTVATFAGTGQSPAPAYTLRHRSVDRVATAHYVFQISPGKLELIAGLRLRPAAGEDLWDAVVRMPDGFTIQGVIGERLRDWWREGDTLHLRFAGATPEITEVALNLTRTLPVDATTVPFAPLAIEGFTRFEGTGLVVAPLGVDATLDFNQPAAVVREISPETANRGFTVLPPFEIKRGFAFDRADWTGTVRTTAIAPQFEADWVLDAEVHDGFIALNASLQVRLRQGALTTVTFTLPAVVPEVEVQGDDVRDVTSVVEGVVRRYTVVLQRETNSPLRFTLSGELPHAGQAPLPDIDLPGAIRIDRFLIVENESDGRLQLTRSGLTEVSREELPFLPEELARSARPAQIFRAQPGWSAAATVESLATTSGQAAVVLEANLTTSLLRNGEEWTRAVYRLHNRSLQFLPVALPGDAQLVSVMVAGRPSRADVGVVDGLPVTLVPLIQTRPGDLSVEVAIVYRRTGPPPVHGVFERSLDDPDLPGLSVQQTLWSVQLPEGFRLRHAEGPMTRVDAAAWDAEKWLGRLAESASLISISSSSGYDETTKKEALKNSSQLLSEIQSLETSSQSRASSASAYRQVAEELEKQQNQITANMAQVAQQADTPPPPEAATVGKKLDYKKVFVENRSASPTAPQSEPAPIQRDGSQLAINDNIVWQAKMAGPASVPPQSQRRRSQIDKLVDRGDVAAQSASTQLFGDFDAAATGGIQSNREVAPQAIPAEPGAQQQGVAFNQGFGNARINAIAPQSQVAAPAADPAGLTAPADPTAAPTPPDSATPAPSTPAAAETPSPSSQPPTDSRAGAAAGLDSHAAVADVFPAQSNAVFFKKIKDQAALQITAAELRLDRRRLTYIGIFLGAVLLTFIAEFLRARFTRRRVLLPILSLAGLALVCSNQPAIAHDKTPNLQELCAPERLRQVMATEPSASSGPSFRFYRSEVGSDSHTAGVAAWKQAVEVHLTAKAKRK